MASGLGVAMLGIYALLNPRAYPEVLPTPSGQISSSNPNGEFIAVIERAIQAQTRFDPEALDKILAPEYVEVSPVGEVDRREAVLSFYAPAKRRPSPAVTISEVVTRKDGATAVAVVRLAFEFRGKVDPRPPVLMRATYVMRRGELGWLITSAQFTPIRPAG